MDDEYYKRQNRLLGTCVVVLTLAVVGLGGYVTYVVVERQRTDAVATKAVEEEATARLVRRATLKRELLSLLGQVRLVEQGLEGKRMRLEMSEKSDASRAQINRGTENMLRRLRNLTQRGNEGRRQAAGLETKPAPLEPTPPIQPVEDSPETKRLRAEVVQAEADLLRLKTREEEVRRRLRDE